jgi:hypothetical protein
MLGGPIKWRERAEFLDWLDFRVMGSLIQRMVLNCSSTCLNKNICFGFGLDWCICAHD